MHLVDRQVSLPLKRRNLRRCSHRSRLEYLSRLRRRRRLKYLSRFKRLKRLALRAHG